MTIQQCVNVFRRARSFYIGRVCRLAGISSVACLILLAVFAVNQARAELVGYWTFDSDDATDYSGFGNHGAVEAYVAFTNDTPTGIGRAAAFAGGNDPNAQITMTNTASLQVDDTMTLCYWVKMDAATPDWTRYIRKNNSSTALDGWMVNRNDSTLSSGIRFDTEQSGGAGNQNTLTGGAEDLDGEWHHVVFVADNGSGEKFVDGVSVQTSTYNHGTGFGNTEPIVLNANDTYTGAFVGALDDVTLWNTALTEGQAIALYNPILGYDLTQMQTLFNVCTSGVPVTIDGLEWEAVTNLTMAAGHSLELNNSKLYYLQLDDDGNGVASTNQATTAVELLGHWSFDNDDATDDSGYGNHGIVDAEVAFTNDTPTGTGRAAAFFDGTNYNAQINIPHNGSLYLDDTMTLCFWMKMDPSSKDWIRVIRKSSSGSAWIVNRYSSSDDLCMRYDTKVDDVVGTDNQNRLKAGNEIDGEWHHVVIVADNGVTEKFVDGVSVRTDSYDHGTGFGNTAPIEINNEGNLIGALDDVSIWYNALSDGMAIALYDPILGFDQTRMATLFNVFLTGEPQRIDGRLWESVSGLTLGEGQSAIHDENYLLQLDSDGNGVASIIEGTLIMIH
jgi:hypothetical protein